MADFDKYRNKKEKLTARRLEIMDAEGQIKRSEENIKNMKKKLKKLKKEIKEIKEIKD